MHARSSQKKRPQALRTGGRHCPSLTAGGKRHCSPIFYRAPYNSPYSTRPYTCPTKICQCLSLPLLGRKTLDQVDLDILPQPHAARSHTTQPKTSDTMSSTRFRHGGISHATTLRWNYRSPRKAPRLTGFIPTNAMALPSQPFGHGRANRHASSITKVTRCMG